MNEDPVNENIEMQHGQVQNINQSYQLQRGGLPCKHSTTPFVAPELRSFSRFWTRLDKL
jgi:hypothetical protein